MNCPLPDPIKYLNKVHKLIGRCRHATCFFVDSDLDSDEMPAGCVLMAAALLASQRVADQALSLASKLLTLAGKVPGTGEAQRLKTEAMVVRCIGEDLGKLAKAGDTTEKEQTP